MFFRNSEINTGSVLITQKHKAQTQRTCAPITRNITQFCVFVFVSALFFVAPPPSTNLYNYRDLKIILCLQHDMIFCPVVPLLFFVAAFVACLLLIPLKMAAPAPRDNIVAANANNGRGGTNAAVIGGDAAAPFPLAAGAGHGPVPGGCGGGGGAPGCAAAHPGSGPRFTTTELEHLNESVESVLPLWVLWNGKKLLSSMQSSTQL
jgi:hypothetical protein